MSLSKKNKDVTLESILSEGEPQVNYIKSNPMVIVDNDIDPEIEKQASLITDKLLSIDRNDCDEISKAQTSIESMNTRLQMEAARKSEMLKEPIRKLAARAEDGGEVATALIDMRVQIKDVDLVNFDLEPGFFAKKLDFLPFVGKPVKKYFLKYQDAATSIEDTMKTLRGGSERLKRDNTVLQADQKEMRELTLKLSKAINLGVSVDRQLSEKLEVEILVDDPQYKFTEEELIFPLRQRILDLQQQLAINQQGVLTIETVIRNNKELIRGVNRTISIATGALHVGVALAFALANQKIVLENINSVNEVIDETIAINAQRLRQQGAEIHKQASSTTLNMDTLKKSFADVNAAIEDISTYRQNALPEMSQSITALNELSGVTEKAIENMEQAKIVHNDFAALEIQ